MIGNKVNRGLVSGSLYVRELAELPSSVQESRYFLNANPITIGGIFTDTFDVKIWSHETAPPPTDQDDFAVIKQQNGLYTAVIGDFCFCGDGSIYRCTDDTAGALVWELITGAATPAPPAGGVKDVGTDYELVAGDDGYLIRVTAAATITLPDGLPANFRVTVANVGAGVVTLAAATTLNSNGTELTTQYTAASIANVGGDVWEAYGMC